MATLWTRWMTRLRKYEAVRHPYPELSAFEDTDLDRNLFFGREKEIEDLLNNLFTSDVVLFFGRSGYGKTSLINAGLMAPLRQNNYFPVVCRLAEGMKETPLDCIRTSMVEAARREGLEVAVPQRCRTLWEFFQGASFRRKARRVRPVLILDQFEQLFTRVAVNPRLRDQFIGELSDLIRRRVPEDLKAEYIDEVERLPVESEERARLVDSLYGSGGPDVKVLISVREAFLGELESLRPQVPAIFSNAVRLEPFTAESARRAITEPAARAHLVGMEPFSFEPAALDDMISFLSLDQRTGQPRTGACIEPAQLQILCHHLSVRRLRTGSKAITARDLHGVRGMRRIMRAFYYRLLRRFPRLRWGWSARRGWPSLTNLLLFHRPRKAIRQLCEYELITASGYRNSLILDAIQRGPGVTKDDLDHLVNLMLLRAEPRLGTAFYELMHDTLIEPLREIRRNRRLARVAFVLALFFLPYVLYAYNNVFGPQGEATARNSLQTAQTSEEDRSEAVMLLINKYKEKNLADLRLDGVRLTYVELRGANLRGAHLREAELSNVDLAEADMREVQAQGMHLRNATLDKSDLRGASLANAELDFVHLQGVDLRGADARGAQFSNSWLQGAVVDGMNIAGTRFDGSDWWMAVGWSKDQLALLMDQHAPSAFSQSKHYALVERLLLDSVRKAEGAQRGDALNNLAWHRATSGANLLRAQTEIEEAIQIGDRGKMFYYLDTRAFIRLQLRNYVGAADDLEDALRLVREAARGATPHSEEGTIHYHLGLAYEGLKHIDQADKAFKRARELGYQPTYERVFTPRTSPRSEETSPSPARIKKILETL